MHEKSGHNSRDEVFRARAGARRVLGHGELERHALGALEPPAEPGPGAKVPEPVGEGGAMDNER